MALWVLKKRLNEHPKQNFKNSMFKLIDEKISTILCLKLLILTYMLLHNVHVFAGSALAVIGAVILVAFSSKVCSFFLVMLTVNGI